MSRNWPSLCPPCDRPRMRARTPRQSAPIDDRRCLRSPYRYRAAELYLDAVCVRRGLSALVLSDEVGVLAGSGPLGCDLDDLAARSYGDRDVHAAPLTLVGRAHRLTALGGAVDVEQLRPDLERILSTRP